MAILACLMEDIMKRVLQIPTGLYGTGEQQISKDIGIYRDPEQFDVQYAVFSEQVERYENELLRAGCTVIHCPVSGKRPLYYFKQYRALDKLMRENRCDVVHSHTMFQSGIAMLAAKKAGVPVRITHSHNAGKHRRRFSGFYDWIMQRLILSSATELLACGTAAGRFLFGEKEFERRGKLILNGVPTERFRFSPTDRDRIRQSLNLGDKYVIGNVARLSKSKHQDYLIDLLPELLLKRPDAVLLLIGDGTDRESLQLRAQRLGLSEKVLFLGWVDLPQAYYSAMDVFALPSLFEGMPLTLMEAQANGLPCVISENVPKDAIQTDLIRAVPLADTQAWISAICDTRRNGPERYADLLRSLGFSNDSYLKKIYACYGD